MFFEDYGHWLMLPPGLILLFLSIIDFSLRPFLLGLLAIFGFIIFELIKRYYYVNCPNCGDKIDYCKLWRTNLKCYLCNYEIGNVEFKVLKKSQQTDKL